MVKARARSSFRVAGGIVFALWVTETLAISNAEILKEVQCDGKAVKQIDLSSQFPETKDQNVNNDGTCYSYGVGALFESAFFRQDGKARSFSPNFSTCVAPRTQRFSDKRDRVKEYISGGRDKYYDAGQMKYAAQAIISQGKIAPESFEKSFLKLNREFENIAKIYTKADQPRDVERAAKAFISTNEKILKKYYSSEKKNIPQIRPSDFKVDSFDTPDSWLDSSDPTECLFSKKNDDAVKQTLQFIMKRLCSGIPVGAAVKVRGMDTTEDGGKSWDEFRQSGGHGMVIQGIVEVNGTPQFVFRNSWKTGPNMSQARFPVAEMCRFIAVTAVRGPADSDVDKDRTSCALTGKTSRGTICFEGQESKDISTPHGK